MKTSAKLEVSIGTRYVSSFSLDGDLTTIGRSQQNTLILADDDTVSRLHAQITKAALDYILIDLSSAVGTYINGIKLKPPHNQHLKHGDVITIGGYQIEFTLIEDELEFDTSAKPSAEETVVSLPSEFKNQRTLNNTHALSAQALDLKSRDQFSIGRESSNDLVISHPIISRKHCQISRQQNALYILDFDSTNGTYLNGKRVSGFCAIKTGDMIQLGPCTLLVEADDTLHHIDEGGNLAIDAYQLNKVVKKDLNLLQNISLSIQPREFVVIAGVSGGGKSTLMDALSGFRPASGFVGVNGNNLYTHFDNYRSQIGYVPQRDIVHMELTIEEALDYAAQLRMPSDTTKSERHRRVSEVIEELGLSHRRKVPIKLLSGGQLKRVSIGVELIVKPSLFFLDEATSGLDPGIEAEIMQLLRRLADQGCTVILVTHATDNVKICDQVVFLARGGYLAYFGPPAQAPAYFGVEKFNQIYQVVEHDHSPSYWHEQYLQTLHFQDYVVSRQCLPESPSTKKKDLPLAPPNPGVQRKRVSSWKQFRILSRRNLRILWRDPASLILMLAIAPVLGLLDLVAWNKPLFSVTEGDAGMTISMLFVTSLIAVMVGSLTSMREIVKERDIYKRERIIGLNILPYLLSKLWIGIFLAFYQSGIFLLFKVIAIDIPTAPNILLGVYVTLVLTTIAGMVMGLLGSSLAPNQNVAPLIAIILLVPQIIFGGGILPTDTLEGVSQVLNQASITKWSFESLVTLTKVGQDPATDECWALDESERSQLSDTQKASCDCMGTSLFKTCDFPGVGKFHDLSVDSGERQEPKKPGDAPNPPEQPSSGSFLAQQQYQVDFSNYQSDLEEYLDRVSNFQSEMDDYTEWRKDFESSMGKAEGLIERFQTEYGSAFNINVGKYWLTLGSLSGVMLGMIFGILKLKD